MGTTLVVMAAGMGSRFGGLKQMEPVGPNGEAILDFSVYDAKKAGFDKVVFVIKKSIEEDFKRKKKSAKGELGKITCEQLYTINGETHNISEWAKIVGISKGNMKARFDQQLCDEDLLRKKRGKKNGKEKE